MVFKTILQPLVLRFTQVHRVSPALFASFLLLNWNPDWSQMFSVFLLLVVKVILSCLRTKPRKYKKVQMSFISVSTSLIQVCSFFSATMKSPLVFRVLIQGFVWQIQRISPAKFAFFFLLYSYPHWSKMLTVFRLLVLRVYRSFLGTKPEKPTALRLNPSLSVVGLKPRRII